MTKPLRLTMYGAAALSGRGITAFFDRYASRTVAADDMTQFARDVA